MGFDPNGNEMIPGFIFGILPSFLLAPKGRKGLGKAAAGGEIWDNLSELDFGLADDSDAIPRQESPSWLSFPNFLGAFPSK